MQIRNFFILISIIITANVFAQSNDKQAYSGICETVKFPGGDTAFLSFVYSNLDAEILKKYPDLKGIVYVGFTLDTSGKIISAEIKANKLNIPDSSKIIKELKRVLLKSPKWEFYDLVREDYDYDEKTDYYQSIEFDNNLPVDDNIILDKTNDPKNSKNNKIEKCKKRKVELIYPFKFPIPKLFLKP